MLLFSLRTDVQIEFTVSDVKAYLSLSPLSLKSFPVHR